MRDVRGSLRCRLQDVDGVLVTHHHGDHAKSVEGVLGAAVNVYASLRAWRAMGCEQHHRAFALSAGSPARIGPWWVAPFATKHNADGALGFLIQGPSGDRILFSVDTAYLPPCADPVGILAVECNWSREAIERAVDNGSHAVHVRHAVKHHMSLDRLLAWLTEYPHLEAVREIHLLHMSSAHGDAAGFVDAVQRVAGTPTYAAPVRRKERQ